MRRRAGRVDLAQPEIVEGLRAVGAFVEPRLSQVGGGVADLLVGFRGVWYVGEVKTGTKPPSRRRLTDDQVGWHLLARLAAPVHTWTCLDDALKTIGILA